MIASDEQRAATRANRRALLLFAINVAAFVGWCALAWFFMPALADRLAYLYTAFFS